MSSPVVIEWNQPNFDYMFHSWDGPTGHYIKSRAERLEMLARGQVGVRTGELKASIGSRYGHRGKSLEVRVGANTHLPDSRQTRGYAFYHHTGTFPHLIKANEAKALRFLVAGVPIYRYSVHHPGTTMNPYLTMFLKEVVTS